MGAPATRPGRLRRSNLALAPTPTLTLPPKPCTSIGGSYPTAVRPTATCLLASRRPSPIPAGARRAADFRALLAFSGGLKCTARRLGREDFGRLALTLTLNLTPNPNPNAVALLKHTYIHTYIHACIHTYIHTYRQTDIHS